MFTSRNGDTMSFERALGRLRDRADDAAFQRYLDWREASSACGAAYRFWATTARSSDRAPAFATYTAALDREERAAARYQAALCGRGGRRGW